eukprot:jgi/Chrpa1/3768/Chrysochromulina_OHIO_Genome00018395-RA
MPPSTKRRGPASSASNARTCIFVAGIAALLLAWLRFAVISDASAVGHQSRIYHPSSYAHNSVVSASTQAVAASTSASLHVDIEGATVPIQPTERQHELLVIIPAPMPLTPSLPLEFAVDAPEQCHARAHTELEGGVVRWGSNHKVASVAECCEACSKQAQSAKSEREACNVWVFCADAALCGDKVGQCWLKHAADPSEPISRGGGVKTPWTSGALLSQPAEHYKVGRRLQRAARQQEPLTVLTSPEMMVGLRNETGTIELLTPHSETQPHFSFPLPLTDAEVHLGNGQVLDRTPDGFHHLGDLTLRATPRGQAESLCSTVVDGQVAAAAKAKAGKLTPGATPMDWSHSVDVGLQRTPGRRRAGDCPLQVTRTLTSRRGAVEDDGTGRSGGLELWFKVHNPSTTTEVTLGALGISMPFDQDFVGRTLVQVAHQCSFVEPFLGMGGGYVQVTRATGGGPVLLLLPAAGTEFEAWRPLRNGEDAMRLDFMYEMSYELLLHSDAYAKGEWRHAQPWNAPTSRVLPPGASAEYGLRFVLAPSLELVEATLLRAGMPVAQPLPSPVIGGDMISAALVLTLPRALVPTQTQQQLTAPTIRVEPSGALTVGPCATAGLIEGAAVRLRCPLLPQASRKGAAGRVRLTIEFAPDGTYRPGGPLRMSVHVFVSAPARELVRLHGEHGATKAWLPVGTPDPWHRDGAFFGWDAAANAPVTQERRVYMSGLSDEAGAGAQLAIAVKQVGAPDLVQIGRLEEFVNHTLFQGSHPDRGRFLQSSSDYSVRLSLLYWTDAMNDASSEAGKAATAAAPELANVCRSCWPKRCSWMDCWSEEHSLESWRAYNYPHVTAVYWSLYRVARWHTPQLTRRDWRWYLRQAHSTSMALWTCGGDPWTKKVGGGIGTTQWGLMVGSIFELVLTDLQREGWHEEARELQQTVEKRMAVWLKMPFPYGSEFAWDSTGHEEIATWMLRFGKLTEARQTLDAVTAYVSASPHWAYCGSARRWWDFTINGATMRGNERVMHHYAAALNSIPIFDHALRHPDDAWLWRLAACANGGTLTNIRPDGSASMGWHGDPDLLSRDAYSADFGVGFYGHWKHAGSYLSCTSAVGWLCVGCDLASARPNEALTLANGSACTTATELRITPRDGFRRKLYLAPLGLLMQLDGATFDGVVLTLQPSPSTAVVRLKPALASSTHTYLTLLADGDGAASAASGADGGARRVRLRCSAPCGFEPTPFPASVNGHVYRVRLGSSEGATLEVSAVPKA